MMSPIQYADRALPILALLINKPNKAEHEALLSIQLCELNTAIARSFVRFIQDEEKKNESGTTEDKGDGEGVSL